jgi:GntR family transcriptional regulator of arabinose operon
MQLKKPRPHETLVEDIRLQISSGLLRSNSYLLPERELAKKYQISSRAVRKGLDHLEANGLIRREQGRGTIVAETPVKAEIKKPQNVAVLFQGRVCDRATAQELDCLQQSFQTEGYGTVLYVANGLPEVETQIVRRLIEEGVPGLVLYSAHSPSSFEHLQEARKAGMKLVVFDHDFPDLDVNFVGIDDRLAAYEATTHLLRLEVAEALLIRSAKDWTTLTLRQQGFEEAVSDWRNRVPSSIVHIPRDTTSVPIDERIRAELLPRLEDASRPLGIVAWCDEIAIEVINILRDAGWSVPGDAKVVSIGNDVRGEVAEIPLTTMSIPRAEISRLAAGLLVGQMRDPLRQPERIRVRASMIIRESCGNYPAPAGARGQGSEEGIQVTAE